MSPAVARFAQLAMLSCLAACDGPVSDCPPSSSAPPGVAVLSPVSAAASARPAPSAARPSEAASIELVFAGGGSERKLSLAALEQRIPAETITQYDPYYAREKTYRAWPLAKVLELGFEGTKDLRTRELVLRAKDGYTVPMLGAKAFEAGAYLAFADVDHPAWEPIGPQRSNPAPLYLVWAKQEQTSLETHPRPYQLARIELARFEDVFPHTAPKGLAENDPGWRGYGIYKAQCVHCHAMNRQGGRVGPELNVPRSIVEYRPVDQIKAYIRDPLAFRYSQMPAHPGLGEAELDALIAYFSAMKERKHDDERAPSAAVGEKKELAPSLDRDPLGHRR